MKHLKPMAEVVMLAPAPAMVSYGFTAGSTACSVIYGMNRNRLTHEVEWGDVRRWSIPGHGWVVPFMDGIAIGYEEQAAIAEGGIGFRYIGHQEFKFKDSRSNDGIDFMGATDVGVMIVRDNTILSVHSSGAIVKDRALPKMDVLAGTQREGIVCLATCGQGSDQIDIRVGESVRSSEVVATLPHVPIDLWIATVPGVIEAFGPVCSMKISLLNELVA